MSWPVRTYRLVSEPSEPGLYCGRDGLTFAGVPLLKSDGHGFEPRTAADLERILAAAFGRDTGFDAEAYLPGLRSVARALEEDDLARAMVASLMLKLPELDSGAPARMAKVDATIKANFNPLQDRDRNGRWTSEDTADQGGGDPNIVPVQYLPRPFPPFFPPLPFPFPGTSGPRRPKDDDDDFPYVPQAGANQPATDSSRTDADAQARTRSEPEICPPATPEPDAKSRTMEQLLYQQQINGLPLGYEVRLNGVGYDGCDTLTGFMKEAKKVNG
jgi:hypothetical protein